LINIDIFKRGVPDQLHQAHQRLQNMVKQEQAREKAEERQGQTS
jgi:hypothetical protein